MKVELPFLADGVEQGDVVSVLVKVGDAIDEGQSLIELETDKATVPVPSPAKGRVATIHVNAGDTVKVGQAILDLDAAETRAKTEKPEQAPIAPAPQPPPKEEAAHAEAVKEEATTAPARPPESTEASRTPGRPERPERAERPSGSAIAAAPSVRRLARELGVELGSVKGSEAGGRITQEDVKAHVRERSSKLQGEGAHVFTTMYGNERREPLPSIRRKITASMSHAWSSIPHVHQFHEADVSELMQLQKRYAPKFKEKGASLTLTSLILKASVHALKAYPKFNANIDLTNGEVIYKDYYNIGVAVDTEAGLIVPVIHHVDKKDLLQIALELADVAERTRTKQVKLEELRGATFTVSNLGGIGGGAFTPIINPPEVSILGIGRGKVTPVFKDGRFEPRTVMPICVAYDHRLIDGADGARFANELVRVLEDYEPALWGL